MLLIKSITYTPYYIVVQIKLRSFNDVTLKQSTVFINLELIAYCQLVEQARVVMWLYSCLLSSQHKQL
jgi:hypothetical protein